MNNIINRVSKWRPSKLVTAALIGAVAVAGGGTAYAAGVTVLPSNVVGSAQIVAGGVWGGDIHDNTIPESKLGWDLRQKINKPAASTPGTPGKSYGCDGAVVDATHPAAKCPGAQGEPGAASTVPGPQGLKGDKGDPATDVKGSTAIYSFDTKTIALIGGSFKTNKTKLGEFTLPEGTFKIDMQYFAARTAAGPAGTRPQLALRYGASATEFGADYGTLLGAEISPSKDRELTASGFKWIHNTGEKTIEVFGFGYNDDGGSAGSGQIDMTAQVVLTRG